MSKQIHDKMSLFKKAFTILLVLDILGLISSVITLLPSFFQMAEYGQIMMVVSGVMMAVGLAILIFEILAKVSLIKSTSPAFSWATGGKKCIADAKLLMVFNFGGAVLFWLATGGEGATLINQVRMYLQVLACAAEVVAAFVYLRTVKKL